MSYTKEDVQKLIEDLTVNPKDSEKWHVLGVAYMSLNRADQAEDALKRCLKLDKNNAFALGDMGGLYILMGKNRQAIKHLEKSVKLEPGMFEYWSALGVAYYQNGKYDDAVQAFQHSLSINRTYYSAVVSLGMTYSKMELWEKALEILNQAEMLSPNNSDVLKAIAKSFRHLNRTEELEQIYLRMHATFPEDASLALYLGKIAFDSGKTQEGLEYYEKAVQIDQESLIGWKVLSEALTKMGRKEEARAAHDRYEEIQEKLKLANTRIIG